MLGSILSNLLLVLGCAFLAGGVNKKEQRFNATASQPSAVHTRIVSMNNSDSQAPQRQQDAMQQAQSSAFLSLPLIASCKEPKNFDPEYGILSIGI